MNKAQRRGRRLSPLATLIILFFTVTLTERAMYGIAHAQGYTPILSVAKNFPLYLPTTFRKIARSLGFDKRQQDRKLYKVSGGDNPYPKAAVAPIAQGAQLNVVWLVSESLRADMLTPEIMPNSWAVAKRGARFTRHYSGGNGTRMGVFSMFYGLYGTYWQSFLAARRGPVIIDLLQDAGYGMLMQTSAHFTYPEFDKTVFAHVPSDALWEDDEGPYWQRDRRNVKRAVQWMRDKAASQEHFFYFQFLESPHAKYHFPPESVIRRPYLEAFNYATVDVSEEIEGIRNRYINAVHHLDQQLGIIFDALIETGLLKNTIVVLTGDHGEEFMEAGHWGHNSSFSNEQIRVPLVILAPQVAPGVVETMSSHLDIAPTVLHLLGVDTPPEVYSLGYDLFGSHQRRQTVISEWNRAALVTEDYKIEIGMTAYNLSDAPVTTAEDLPVADASKIYAEQSARLVDVVREMSVF